MVQDPLISNYAENHQNIIAMMVSILKNLLNRNISDVSISNIDYKGTKYLYGNLDAFSPFCRIQ